MIVKIKVAVASPESDSFRVVEAELDPPRPDEICVRILAVGLCHTDIFAQKGGYRFDRPGVFGHEGAGIVEAVGEGVSKVKPGDRVALSFRSCGACESCAGGHPARCRDIARLNFAGTRPDGSSTLHSGGVPLAASFFGQSSFASHVLTYERNVVPIGADIPFEIAAPTVCSGQTGVGAVHNILRPPPGASFLVAGCGPVGLCAVMGASLAGCGAIIAVEPLAERRRLARELGATHAADPLESADLAEAVRQVLPSGVQYAFDTTGREDVLAALLGALAPGGTLGYAGISKPGGRLPIDLNVMMRRGLTVKGVYLGDADPDRFLPELFDQYRAGQLPIDRIIATYPFERINEAVGDQNAGKVAKAVLLLDRSPRAANRGERQ